jgi:hypothetical protein
MKSPYLHLIIWLAICGATFVGYGFWYTAVANKSSAVANLQNQIDTQTQTSARVAAARTALADISGDESLVQNYFVAETGVVPFIDTLQSLAQAQTATLKVLSVSTDGSAAQSNLVLLLTISIDGTFDSVMRSVGAVEYAPYDITVSQLSVTKDDKNAWHADLELIVGSVPVSQASSTPNV